MRKQRGYINIDGLIPLVYTGILACILVVLIGPFAIYYQYHEYKENQQLIRDCERGLPGEQTCEIVKVAKLRSGEPK